MSSPPLRPAIVGAKPAWEQDVMRGFENAKSKSR
jgi:hypothetical protein